MVTTLSIHGGRDCVDVPLVEPGTEPDSERLDESHLQVIERLPLLSPSLEELLARHALKAHCEC
jgi:hypothetical protein